MKNGTLYAGRLQKAYAKQRQESATPTIPEPEDPLHRLAVAVLGVGIGEREAIRAVTGLMETMVDWNEVRVSSPAEVNNGVGEKIPDGIQRCRQLITALQSIFDRENALSLDRLKTTARREARHYLEELEGVDDYVGASIVLWSLGGHAVPVNDHLLDTLRAAEIVPPSASRKEVQAFLERHINAADAKEFCLVMQFFKPKTKTPTHAKKSKKKAAPKRKTASK